MSKKLTVRQVVRGALDLVRAKSTPVSQTSSVRLQACMRCERLERVSLRCRECGCPVKELTKLADKECPLGVW